MILYRWLKSSPARRRRSGNRFRTRPASARGKDTKLRRKMRQTAAYIVDKRAVPVQFYGSVCQLASGGRVVNGTTRDEFSRASRFRPERRHVKDKQTGIMYSVALGRVAVSLRTWVRSPLITAAIIYLSCIHLLCAIHSRLPFQSSEIGDYLRFSTLRYMANEREAQNRPNCLWVRCFVLYI